MDLDELIARVDERVLGDEPLASSRRGTRRVLRAHQPGRPARRPLRRGGAPRRLLVGADRVRPRRLAAGRAAALRRRPATAVDAHEEPWRIGRGALRARRAPRRRRGAGRGATRWVTTTSTPSTCSSASSPPGPTRAGATMLERCGLTWAEVEKEVASAVGREPEPTKGHIPFSAGAKKALELSLPEAIASGHRRIGTEHLLLALMRERTGLAAQLLARHGVELDRVDAFVRERPSGMRGRSLRRSAPGPRDSSSRDPLRDGRRRLHEGSSAGAPVRSATRALVARRARLAVRARVERAMAVPRVLDAQIRRRRLADAHVRCRHELGAGASVALVERTATIASQSSGGRVRPARAAGRRDDPVGAGARAPPWATSSRGSHVDRAR